MKAITMTVEQTARYDDDDATVIDEMREQAAAIREGNETVEIYTVDGIVVDVAQD